LPVAASKKVAPKKMAKNIYLKQIFARFLSFFFCPQPVLERRLHEERGNTNRAFNTE